MKNAIKLTALLLLAGSSIFAAPSAHKTRHIDKPITDMVTFSTTPSRTGVDVKVDKNAPGKAVVLIYNYENDVVWKDVLKKNRGMEKAFNLSELGNGNYTVQVILNKQKVQKTAHVYYKGDDKFVELRG